METQHVHYAIETNETHGPTLLSTCEHPYLKGLRIARHNKAIHLISKKLQAILNPKHDGEAQNVVHKRAPYNQVEEFQK